jgi:hypothetical protein
VVGKRNTIRNWIHLHIVRWRLDRTQSGS